jgi:hypothetical protein
VKNLVELRIIPLLSRPLLLLISPLALTFLAPSGRGLLNRVFIIFI